MRICDVCVCICMHVQNFLFMCYYYQQKSKCVLAQALALIFSHCVNSANDWSSLSVLGMVMKWYLTNKIAFS